MWHCAVAHHYHLLRIAYAVALMDGYKLFDMLVARRGLRLFPNLISTLTSTAHQSVRSKSIRQKRKLQKKNQPNDILIHFCYTCSRSGKSLFANQICSAMQIVTMIKLTIAYAIVIILPSCVRGVKLPYPEFSCAF